MKKTKKKPWQKMNNKTTIMVEHATLDVLKRSNISDFSGCCFETIEKFPGFQGEGLLLNVTTGEKHRLVQQHGSGKVVLVKEE